MDKPRLQRARRQATLEAAQQLQSGVIDGVREEIITLIKEEKSVQEWARRVREGANSSSYKQNMQTAFENSLKVEGVLRGALSYLKKGNTERAAQKLMTVTGIGSKANRADNTLVKLYQEYLIRTDKNFHMWLKSTGNKEALESLGIVNSAPAARDNTGHSNRPEDY